MSKALTILALVLCLVTAPALSAVIYWNNDDGGNWATPEEWTAIEDPTEPRVPTAADDVVFGAPEGPDIGNRTYTLSSPMTVNSLSFLPKVARGGFNASGDGALTINTGNILFSHNSPTYSSYGVYVNMPLIIPATAVEPVWTLARAGTYNVRSITTSADTTLTIERHADLTSTPNFNINANNQSTLLGDILLKTPGIKTDSDHGFGSGTLRLGNNAAINANAPTSTTNPNVARFFANDFDTNGYTLTLNNGGDYFSVDSVSYRRQVVLEGNITGTGNIVKMTTSNDSGMFTFAGEANTISGNVSFSRGVMNVLGTFTQLGDITMGVSNGSSFLAGTGTIGMGQDKVARLYGSSTLSANLAPGEAMNTLDVTGNIGTLTLGTAGMNNVLQMESDSRFLVDVNATDIDLLVLIGALNLDYADNALYLAGELGSIDYDFATFTAWDGGKFASVYWNGELVETPEALGAIGGTHSLTYGDNSLSLAVVIPEPMTLALLAVGGVAVVFRRRR